MQWLSKEKDSSDDVLCAFLEGLNGLADGVDLGGDKVVWISSFCHYMCCVIVNTKQEAS